jgi:hypothetical protein
MSINSNLEKQFSERLINSLEHNNVLRGSWAEEITASYLNDCKFSPQWSFFDFTWNGQRVSVKHSVGKKARFGISAASYGWDPYEEAFIGDGKDSQAYLCDLYIFAWLPSNNHPDLLLLDLIRDTSAWQFSWATRFEMMNEFANGQKTASHSTINSIRAFVHGHQLLSQLTAQFNN